MREKKYDALGRWLASSGLERVRLTYAELDALCGLPPIAYKDRPFWANTWSSNHAKSWLQEDYIVDEVSLGNFVVFQHDPVRANDPGVGRKNSALRKQAPIYSMGGKKMQKTVAQSTHDYLPLTAENVERIHRLAIESKQYGGSFAMIHDVLCRFPKNTDRELVAMKISVIDVTNSTNLGKYLNVITLEELTDLILSIQDFDVRVAQGDPDLVSQLARSNGKINLFSFASKYCTYHNVDIYARDDYSIFDGIVKRALPHYVYGLREATVERWRATFDYAAFSACIGDLLEENEIAISFRRRKFDHFLWYANRK